MTSPATLRRAPYLGVVVAAAAAVSLTGCGTTDPPDTTRPGGTKSVTPTAKTAPSAKATPSARAVPSAKTLYGQMRANVSAAKSVRIRGRLTDAGKKMRIDIAGDRDGKSTRALVSDGSGQAELRTIGRTVYLKADEAYWTKHASATAARIAADKFVKIPPGTGVGDLKVGSLLDGAFQDLPLAGALQKVEPTSVNGVPAYVLADRVGSEGRIYVSADGKARLLRLVSTKGNSGTLDFSQWNAVPPQSPPPASQVVTIPGIG